MHEFSLMADLMAKVLEIARQQQAQRVTRVEVWLGALCHLSPSHFREHFEAAARGSVAEGAALAVVTPADIHDARAGDVRLLSVDVLP